MPLPLIRTPPLDPQIRRMRAEGASWDEIAADLHVSRWAVIDRARKLGAGRLPTQALEMTHDLGREPLPAGHRVSWDVLLAGTILEGNSYPWPPLNLEA